MAPSLLQPLTWNVPIVDKNGRPTPEFMRKWAQQFGINAEIPDLSTPAAVSAVLDILNATRGAVLYRGEFRWAGLAPGTDGYVLSTHGAGADPTWVPGGSLILGAGAPTALEPAGTLYSQTDADALYASHPIAAPTPTVVQHKSAINGNTIPGAVTLTTTPTAGNLIVMFLHTNVLASLVTKNTTGWTEFENVTVSSSQLGSGLYRYVQLGDTSTLPALWTAGSTYWAYDVYEISGVSGVFAADAIGHNQASAIVNVTALSSPSPLVTTLPNALALLGAGQYNGNADPTLSVGWTRDEFGHNNSNYGSNVGGSQAVAASGTGVSATVTFTTNSSPADLIVLVLQNTAPETAHWDLLAPYTDEQAQDAVGAILTDTATIDFTYNDSAPSITADVKNGSITYAKIQNVTDARLLGRSSGSAGPPIEITVSTGLSLAAGALTSTITQYTDEMAEDAVGGTLTDTNTIDLTYDDAGNSISADLKWAQVMARISFGF